MKKTRLIVLATAIMVLISSTYFFAVNLLPENPSNATLRVVCATSLLYPLEKVEKSFEKAYPSVDLEIEGHGSIQVIRQVTELGRSIDLIMVADYSLIPVMMYNTSVPNTNQNFANYYLRFAENSMVLAYTNGSRYAQEINQTNWYSILANTHTRLGLANPELDALGYRALAVIQLAENYYDSQGLFHSLITSNFDPPISSIPEGDGYSIIVPEVQQPKGDKITLRASEVDLIGLLQTGNLDYCLVYFSNAKQYGLNYIELPSEINLGSSQHKGNYELVNVIYEQQRFATVNLDRTGETIYYGLTIPQNAPNKELAVEFIKFLINAEGRDDFAASYHPIFNVSFTDNMSALPNGLQALAENES